MRTARAAIFEGTPERMEVRDIPFPDLQPGETLVRVLGCTLCGSDLHTFDGRRQVATPTILGHEIVGEVVDSRPNSALSSSPLFTAGDRVTWAIVASCGSCFYCRRNLPQKCLRSVKYGHERFVTGREWFGGLAEYCVLAPGTSVFHVPRDLPLSVACPASCATATVSAAFEAAAFASDGDESRGAWRDRSVCLLGAGTLGLTAAAMARSAGASCVVCIDPQSTRLDMANRFGASHVGSPNDLESLRRSCDLPHGFDVIIELSGANAAFESAWPHLRLGGTIVLVGAVFPSPAIPVSLEQVVRRNISLRGVHNYAPAHLRHALEFLDQNHSRYPFGELVRGWFPLDEIVSAFATARTPGVLRVGVTPS